MSAGSSRFDESRLDSAAQRVLLLFAREKIMNHRIAAACAVGLMLQSTFAFADAIATASFSNIKVELLDLDPGDGIAPSVTFYGVSAAQAITDYGPDNQANRGWNYGTTSFGAVSNTAPASPWNGSSGSFSGDVYAGTGLAIATGRATGLQGPYGAVADGLGEVEFAGVSAPTDTGFLLSPHTELVISGFADLEGQLTPGGYGQAMLSMLQMDVRGDTSAGPQDSAALLRATLDATSPSSVVTNEMELSVSFSNADATSASGTFFALLSADAVSVAPELPTSTLLLAALAAMGIAARSRRSTR